ncbi:MAG: hypothetical protein HZB99_04020 [Candidatus Harrisonbacteria bacterium]|nr:hypothetical protein [Candidatus Harrisonbacteria bacterium]
MKTALRLTSILALTILFGCANTDVIIEKTREIITTGTVMNKIELENHCQVAIHTKRYGTPWILLNPAECRQYWKGDGVRIKIQDGNIEILGYAEE